MEISAELQRQQRSPWRHRTRQVQALLIDLLLLTLFVLMVEFLFVAFSGRRGPTGLLVTPEEILDLLHYGRAVAAAAFLALLWGAGSRLLGASPGRALVLGVPEREGSPPWTHTLRGWFSALLVELTVFTGWLITEVQLVTFLTQFSKASDIVRGLLHPSSSVLHQGLVLLVQTIFLAFMATAFAIPVAFCLSFLAARNLTRDSFVLHSAYTVVRAGMNFTRAVEPLVWALIFISWVGIGPFAGVLALWVHSVAALVKLYSEQIRPFVAGDFHALGTDGFGRSDSRPGLRAHFEVDRYHVAVTALKALADQGAEGISANTVLEALSKYGIDAEKPNPLYA